MKHIYRKLTALAAAAITAVSALSATGLTASAYPVTRSSQLTNMNLDQNELTEFLTWVSQQSVYARGSLTGRISHTYSSERYQKLYPEFTYSFMKNRASIPCEIASTTSYSFGSNTSIFCTFDSSVVDFDKPQRAATNLDKLTVKRTQRNITTNYGLVVEYDDSASPNQFAGRLMDDYHVKNHYLNKLYLEDFTFDDITGAYSGSFALDDYYICGMRLSSSDPFTTFERPEFSYYTEGSRKYPKTLIRFSGQVPNPDRPIYEGVYDKFMTEEEFTDAIWWASISGSNALLRQYDGHILTNLTATYNGSGNVPYTTNRFQLYPQVAEIVGL